MEFDGNLTTRIINNSDTLTLDVVPGNYCNYNCWYCWPDAHANSIKLPPLNETAKNNLEYIIKKLQGNKKKFVVKFSGGEPTVHVELENYCRYFKKKLKAKIEIITNGSRTIRWWKRNLDLFDAISVSVHPLDADVDHLIELGNLFKENNKMYNMRVSIVPNEIELVGEVAKKLSSNGIRVNPKYLDLTFVGIDSNDQIKTKEYSSSNYKVEGVDPTWFHDGQGAWIPLVPEDITIYSKSSNKENLKESWIMTSLEKFNGTFDGYLCYAPSEYIFLKPDGVLGLTCHNNIQNKIKVMNIFEDDYTTTFLNPNVLCTTGYCKCEGLWKVSKIHVDH